MKRSAFIKGAIIGGPLAMIQGFFCFLSLGMSWRSAILITLVLSPILLALCWFIVFRWFRRED